MPKMIISAFQGSTTLGHLRATELYRMYTEVCVPVYSRLSSGWTPEARIQRSLNGDFYGNTE